MSTRKNVKRQRRDAQPLLMRSSLTEEILFDILAKLPVKSLLRFRCVYKSWNNLIISPSFINAHLKSNVVQNFCNHLLIHTDMSNCLSLFDAETFSKRLDLELPGHDFGFVVHGSWNGLVCISNSAFMTLESPVYLWNPSIRNLKRLPNSLQHTTAFVHLGFGFHSEVDNYRVVRVARFLCNKSIFGIEVYNFRLNCWRTITTVPPVSNDVNFLQSACVFLNGVVYWITKEPSQHSPSILTFDLGSEVFQKILLPETTVEVPTDVGIQVVENSVSLFQVRTDRLGLYCDISVLEENTWKMMQTIIFPYSKLAWPLGMEADGRLHLAIKGDNPDHPELVLFDPKSIEIRVTGIGLNCK